MKRLQEFHRMWHNPDDEMPPQGEHVIVWANFRYVAYPDDITPSGWRSWPDNKELDGVTHWTPLPELPT